MKRFLLFDADCNTCSQVAQAVEPYATNWLEIRSLHNSEMQELLAKANPAWVWKPTLLEVRDDKLRILTGFRMALAVALGVGPIRAWHIARKLSRYGVLKAVLTG